MTETLPYWVEVLASVLLLAGGVFALVGTIGLVRLRDFVLRLHGPTKVSTLGIGLLLVASMLVATFGEEHVAVHELMITLFIFLTAPISAHLLVRAALRTRPGLRPAGAGDGTAGGADVAGNTGPTDAASGDDGGRGGSGDAGGSGSVRTPRGG